MAAVATGEMVTVFIVALTALVGFKLFLRWYQKKALE
jgi:uncharacterized protein (UPF0212 family)